MLVRAAEVSDLSPLTGFGVNMRVRDGATSVKAGVCACVYLSTTREFRECVFISVMEYRRSGSVVGRVVRRLVIGSKMVEA